MTTQKTIPVTRCIGQVREIPSNVEETRIIPIVLSTSKKDRHGTVLNIDGWNVENYTNNPIVGYQHEVYGGSWSENSDPDRVIAKDTGIVFESDVLGSKMMIGNPCFEPKSINDLAEKIFRKLIFGSLRSASVGFNSIGSGHWDSDGEGAETYYYSGQELLEYSIVNIPSNPDAYARKMSGEVAGVLNYALQQLGDKFTRAQLERFSVADIITLIEGRDFDIATTDVEKVKRQLDELAAKDKQIDELTRQRDYFKAKARQ